jgi:hypothetical protein
MNNAQHTDTMDAFYEEICVEILKAIEASPNARDIEVTREVAMGMLLGEDDSTHEEILRRLGI